MKTNMMSAIGLTAAGALAAVAASPELTDSIVRSAGDRASSMIDTVRAMYDRAQPTAADMDGAPGLVLACNEHENEVKRYVFEHKGKAPVASSKGRMGIVIEKLDDSSARHLKVDPKTSIFIKEVIPGSAADRSGFRDHDIIKKLRGHGGLTIDELKHKVQGLQGDVEFEILREGKPKVLRFHPDGAVKGKPHAGHEMHETFEIIIAPEDGQEEIVILRGGPGGDIVMAPDSPHGMHRFMHDPENNEVFEFKFDDEDFNVDFDFDVELGDAPFGKVILEKLHKGGPGNFSFRVAPDAPKSDGCCCCKRPSGKSTSAAPHQKHREQLHKHLQKLQGHNDKVQEHRQRIHEHALKLHAHKEKLHAHKQRLHDHNQMLHDHKQRLHDHKQRIHEHKQRLHEQHKGGEKLKFRVKPHTQSNPLPQRLGAVQSAADLYQDSLEQQAIDSLSTELSSQITYELAAMSRSLDAGQQELLEEIARDAAASAVSGASLAIEDGHMLLGRWIVEQRAFIEEILTETLSERIQIKGADGEDAIDAAIQQTLDDLSSMNVLLSDSSRLRHEQLLEATEDVERVAPDVIMPAPKFRNANDQILEEYPA